VFGEWLCGRVVRERNASIALLMLLSVTCNEEVINNVEFVSNLLFFKNIKKNS
jgi:hypothetical protein